MRIALYGMVCPLAFGMAACTGAVDSSSIAVDVGAGKQASARMDSHDKHTSPLVFEPPELDIGSVKEGDKAVAYIRVRNAGSQMQTITRMQTSCGCSMAEPEQRLLPPGSFTRVKIVIDTFAKQQEVTKWVELTDGQGRRSRAILHLNVQANPHLQAEGRSIFDGKCAACHVDPAKGKTSGHAIYKAVCAMCHGKQAAGAYAPALRGYMDADILVSVIARGTGSQYMPGFARDSGGPLDTGQIAALARWLSTLDE